MAVGQIRSYSEAAQVRPSGPTCYYCACEAITRTRKNRPLCRKHDDERHLAECKTWLLDNRIVTEQMTKGERMKAMAEYRASLRGAGLWVAPIVEDDDDAPPF